MPIAALVTLLVQVLPGLISDGEAVISLLDTSSAAIKNAQSSGGGLISTPDWAAIQEATSVDLAQLATDAGITLP